MHTPTHSLHLRQTLKVAMSSNVKADSLQSFNLVSGTWARIDYYFICSLLLTFQPLNSIAQ